MTVNSHTNDQDLVIPVQDEEERLNILLEKMSNDNESGDSDNGIDMNNEINDELDPSTNEVSGTSFVTFNGQQWWNSKLQLRASMPTDDTQWIDFHDAKEYYHRITASYLVEHYK